MTIQIWPTLHIYRGAIYNRQLQLPVITGMSLKCVAQSVHLKKTWHTH